MKHLLGGLIIVSATCALAQTRANAVEEETKAHLARQLAEVDQLIAQGPWEPNWDSLTKHPIPEWFKDAKLGIYAHLGVYCVPAYGTEWYPRKMYQKKDGVYQHHVKTYGDPSEFGYKDFVPMFTLDKFDAAEWAELYKQAGARFAGPVAEHHDGFSMWASKVNRWSVGGMGPKRDIAGELIEEIRKRDMKIIASFHHAFNVQGYYTPGDGWDTADPQYGDLYGYPLMKDRKLAHDRWLIKMKEVIDNYRPDQIWFDFGLGKIPDEYKQRFAAYYYNHEKVWDTPLIITRKNNFLPEGVGALDIERGRMKGMGKELWQTDDSTAYNSWSWVKGLRVKPTEEMVHELIDIVSKNGVLLLNVCPKADGTISEDQQQMLRELGQWLEVNGEAIYDTRPWVVFGEGPTRMEKGGAFVGTTKYGSHDFRFTRSKDGKTLYAIALGWPQHDVTLKTVKVRASGKARVNLLGHPRSLSLFVSKAGELTFRMPSIDPDERPGQHAYAFKITGCEFELSEQARFMMPGAITLTADKAVLDGEKINTEEKNGRTNIGFWDNPNESIHWLARISEPGTYDVIGEFASVADGARLVFEMNRRGVVVNIPNTNSWDRPQAAGMGQLRFEKPGVYHLILRAHDPKTWKAINVWQIQLAPAKK